jgi:predicted permease
MDTILQDLRYAARSFLRNPFVAVVIVMTLAIGIGANTAIYTLVDAVLVRALPFRDAERLVAVWLEFEQQPGVKAFAAYRDFEELRKQATSFEDLAANTWAVGGRTLLWRGEPHYVTAIPATANLFALLGSRAAQGRTFEPSDVDHGCAVVLADRFWRSELGGEPNVVDRTLTLDGESCVVTGIMPADFEFFPRQTQVWTLLAPADPLLQNPLASVAIFGRLKAGVTREAAAAEVALIHRRIAEETPADSFMRGTRLGVYDLQGELTFLAGSNLRSALLMLTAAVATVLLICCVNVAGLLIGRGSERRRELAMRAALGSGRARIVRQLVTEAAILGAAGAGLGALLAAGVVSYFKYANPIDLPAAAVVAVNGRVLAFTAAAGAIAALLFGVLPALRISRLEPNEVLRGTSVESRRRWLAGGRLLVVGELALSMVLLTAAALLVQSIERLTSVPLSFRTDHLLLATATLPAAEYADSNSRANFFAAAQERIGAIPGVDGAAFATNRPLAGQVGLAVTIEGRPGPTSEIGDVARELVSDTFMHVMAIPLLRGRELDSRDRDDTERVALVNQQFVDEYLPNQEPLGARVKVGAETSAAPWLTIVGVVGNTERSNFFEEMSYRRPPTVYRPLSQQADRSMDLLVRTTADVPALGDALRREIRALDARVPLHDVTTMDDELARNFAQPRLRTQLLGAFAALGLLLASLGVYGLLTRGVVQRTRELGIRMALGADGGRVLRSVLLQGLALSSLGILAGLLASAYLTRFLSTMLYGVGRLDPATVAATAVILTCATLVATYLPARRATRVDPLVALKD